MFGTVVKGFQVKIFDELRYHKDAFRTAMRRCERLSGQDL